MSVWGVDDENWSMRTGLVETRMMYVPDNGVCSVASAAILKLKLPGVGKIFVSDKKFGVDVCSDSASCSLLLADAGGRSDAAAPESDESSLLPPLPLLPPVSSNGSHLMLSSRGLFSSCTPLPSTLLDRWLFFTIEKSVGVASLLLRGGDGTLGFFADSSCGSGVRLSFLRICARRSNCCTVVGVGVTGVGGDPPRGKLSSDFSWKGRWLPPAANARTWDSCN